MKYLSTFCFLLLNTTAFGQQPPEGHLVAKAALAPRDTTIEADTSKENKEPRYYYRSIDNRSAQYMGLAFTYNFLKPHSVNKQGKKKTLVATTEPES